MEELDVTQTFANNTSTPEEAAENIREASYVNVPPDTYKEMKAQYKPELEQAMKPTRATRSVANYASQSRENASLVEKSVDKMSWLETQSTIWKNAIEGTPTYQRELSEIGWRAMTNGGMNDDDKFNAEVLRSQISDYEKQRDRFNSFESVQSRVLEGVSSIVQSAVDEKTLILGGAGVGATLYGAIGSLGGLPGAATGITVGAVKGASAAGFAAALKDGFEQTSGLIYEDLSSATNDKGEPLNIPHDEKQAIAVGVGLLSGSADAALSRVMLTKTPWIAKYLGTAGARTLVMDPANAAMREAFMNIGKSAIAAGATNGVNEALQIFAEQYGRSWNGTEPEFMNAVQSIAKDAGENVARVTKAGAIGAATGGAIATATNVVGFGATRNRFASEQDAAVRNARDANPLRLESTQEQSAFMRGEKALPGGPSPDRGVVPSVETGAMSVVDNLPSRRAQFLRESSTRSLQLYAAMMTMRQISDSTNMNQVSPDELNSLRGQILKETGFDHLYIDPEDLRDLSTDAERARKIRNIIDPTGTLAAQVDSPIRVEMNDFLKLSEEIPDLMKYAKAQPEDLPLNKAEQYLEALQKNADKRTELLGKSVLDDDLVNPELAANIEEGQMMIRNATEHVLPEAQQVPIMSSGADFGGIGPRLKSVRPEVVTLNDGTKVELRAELQEREVYSNFSKKNIKMSSPAVTAYVNGEKIGYVEIGGEFKDDKFVTTPDMVEVKEEFRRKGLATAMYDFSNRKVAKLEPSQYQTEDGKNFTVGRINKRDQFLNKDVINEAIRDVISPKQVEKYEAAQARARDHVDQIIQSTADAELNKVKDVMKEIAMEAERDQAAATVDQNPNIAIVENFINGKILNYPNHLYGKDPRTFLTMDHAKKGFPILAIDPRDLSPEMQAKYKDDPVLRARKVFVKGGRGPEEVARMLNVGSADQLLEILRAVPSRKEAIKQAVERASTQVDDQLNAMVDRNETAIDKAYTNLSRTTLETMKFMKAKEWPQMKSGVRKIVLPLPHSRDMRMKAEAVINNTPIRNLNPKQFDVGMRRTRIKAADAILKNQAEEAFLYKEKELNNIELARATRLAISRSNRNIKKIASLRRDSVQKQIKNAGPEYENAFNEIAAIFDLSGKDNVPNTKEGFKKYVQTMAEKGEGNFDIPDEMLQVKTPIRDLTPDQLDLVTGTLTGIAKTARTKSRLLDKHRAIEEETTRNAIVQALETSIMSNPRYGTKPLVEAQGQISFSQKAGRVFRTAESLLSDIDHIVNELDDFVVAGPWHQQIIQPLRGTGIYKGVWGQSALTKSLAENNRAIQAGIAKMGESEFNKMATDVINVPEFFDSQPLNGGKMNRMQIFVMAMHLGTDGNLDALARGFGIPGDRIERVIERELKPKHLEFIQEHVWDRLAALKPMIEKLHLLTEGEKPEFIDNREFDMFGKRWRGGYMRLYRQNSTDFIQAAKENFDRAKQIISLNNGEFSFDYASDGMTRRGHLMERTGSDKPVNLSLLTLPKVFEDVLYDLHMRVPVRDTLSLLQDTRVAEMITSTVGSAKYQAMMSTVMEATGRGKIEPGLLYSEQNALSKAILSGQRTAFAATYLTFSPATMAIQAASLGFSAEAMGLASGTKYITEAATKFVNILNYGKFKEFYDLAVEINPAIATHVENVNETSMGILADSLPKERTFPKIAGVLDTRDWLVGKGFQLLGSVDTVYKVIVAHAAYTQFTEGNAPGWTPEKIAKLTDDERHAQASAYAAGISNLTMTHTDKLSKVPFQKIPGLGIFSMFLHDAKNAFQNSTAVLRQIKNASEKSGDFTKAGDMNAAVKELDKARDMAIVALIVSTGLSMFENGVRGNEIFPKNIDWNNPNSVDKVMEFGASKLLQSPADFVNVRFGNTVPLVRDLNYMRRNEWVKSVTTPMTSSLGDGAKAMRSLTDIVRGELKLGSLNQTELKEIVRTASIATGGFPVNGPFKVYDMMLQAKLIDRNTLGNAVDFIGLGVQEFTQAAEKLITKNRDTDEFSEEYLRQLEEIKIEVNQETVDRLPPMPNEPQEAVSENWDYKKRGDLSPNDYEYIRHIESQGARNARPIVKVGSSYLELSKAVGYYQFLPKTWKGLMNNYPELELTELGRTGMDDGSLAQQERAMRALVKESIRILRGQFVPINPHTVYSAHAIGPDLTRQVFKAKGNPPLSNFMTNTEMRNHNLFTVVGGSKIVFNWTVNDYKKWLSNKFASAKKDYEQVLLNPEILAEREAKNEQTYKKYLAQERVKKGKRKTNIVDN